MVLAFPTAKVNNKIVMRVRCRLSAVEMCLDDRDGRLFKFYLRKEALDEFSVVKIRNDCI